MLPDGNGVELAQQLKQMIPKLQVIMMTGSVLAPEEEAICEEHDFPVLRKPFLATDVMNQIRSRLAGALQPDGDAIRPNERTGCQQAGLTIRLPPR